MAMVGEPVATEPIARPRAEDVPTRLTHAIWAIVGVAYALQALTIIRASWAWVVSVLPDDAFYYLEIARRLGRGEGPTFDGINQTNGFHPLWEGLLTPLGWIFREDAAFAKAAMLLGLALGFASLVLLARLMRPVVGPTPAALCALVVVHGAGAMLWHRNGMESALVVFALVVAATALRAFDERRTTRSAVVLGLACGLVVLARIDFALVILLVPLAAAIRVRDRWPVWPWLAGGGVLVVPVVVANYLAFGHLLTVSGSIKLAGMSTMADERWGGRLTPGYASYVLGHASTYVSSVASDVGGTPFADGSGLLGEVADLLLLVVAVAGAVWWWRGRDRSTPPEPLSPVAFSLVVIGLIVGLKGLTDLVLVPDWAESWYSAPQRVAAGCLVAVGAWAFVRRVPTSTRLGAGIVVAVLLVLAFPIDAWTQSDVVERGTDWRSTLDETTDWVVAEGPPGRYGAFDAGVLGYRLDDETELVNLDGLVNDYGHADLVMAGASRLELLRHNDIDYLVNRLPESELDLLDCASELWRSPEPVPYDGTESYVYVLDVRACTA